MTIASFIGSPRLAAQSSETTSIYVHPVVGEPVPADLNSNYDWPITSTSDCNSLNSSNPCPYDGQPIRYMAVNVHYLLSSDGKWNFTETGDGAGGSYNGYQRAEDLVKEANAQLSQNEGQFQAVTVPVCKINLQLVLAGVYFHRTSPSVQVGTNPVKYNWQTVWPTLNGYMVNNTSEINCFFFNATPSADGTALSGHVALHNDWERYKKWEKAPNSSPYPRNIGARILLHEIFHNNGLRSHPYQGDQCDDTPTFPRCWELNNPPGAPCNNWVNISNNLMDYNSYSNWSLSPCQICEFNENIQTDKVIAPNPTCPLPAPVRAFFEMPDVICAGNPVILEGSASFNENNYYIEIQESSGGSFVPKKTKTFAGQVGNINLGTAMPFNFISGKTYRVVLTVWSILGGCESTHVMARTFKVESCGSTDATGDEIISLSVSPNPSTGLVNIQFDLDVSRDLSLQVYHVHSGTLVGTLKNMDMTPAGLSTFSWDAAPFSDGWYYVRAVTQNQAKTAQFLLQK